MIKLQKLFFIGTVILMMGCSSTEKSESKEEVISKYPSDVISNLDQWKILLGNGETVSDLINYEQEDYFFDASDGANWVVFKAPNGGVTSPNSHNTRTELGQKKRWTPMEGGKLKGTLKVMHVSTSGDARVAASYSVVIGQIHSDDGHKNEPLKIFYKKFPGHEKGSVYWNYEINTEGSNDGRWDFSTPVWGYDMSVVGSEPDVYPNEPEEGIELGEVFSYEVNVYKGIMYLTFSSEGHETKIFTKSLIESEFINKEDIPQQTKDLFVVIGRDGTEKPSAYTGESQFFKQGAYNQTNGRQAESNMVWSSESITYGGDLEKQYANGCYTEVWFSDSYVGPGKLLD